MESFPPVSHPSILTSSFLNFRQHPAILICCAVDQHSSFLYPTTRVNTYSSRFLVFQLDFSCFFFSVFYSFFVFLLIILTYLFQLENCIFLFDFFSMQFLVSFAFSFFPLFSVSQVNSFSPSRHFPVSIPADIIGRRERNRFLFFPWQLEQHYSFLPFSSNNLFFVLFDFSSFFLFHYCVLSED